MKNSDKKVQYIAWGICVVIAIALAILVITDRKKNQERILQMQMEAQLQEGDTESAASGNTKANNDFKKASSAYKDLVSRLQLNSFVFWGDNEMSGNEKGSLPQSFCEVANGELLALLSEPFGEVIEQENRAIPSMPINNMGAANEGMSEILTRAGVYELEVGEWALISEEREPINLVLRNGESGSTLHFAQQKAADFGQVEITGVKGTLTKGEGMYDEDHPRFAFLRDRAGSSFQAGLGTDIEIESATKYIGNVPIFFFEDDTVDSAGSVDEFVSDLERLVQRYTEIEEEDSESSEELPYVVICTADEESDLDDSLKEVFGNHYIRHDTYANEMTKDDYEELAQKVYANLDGQGCFDAMKEMIDKATEELKTAE